jgi:hypothetical protein
MITNIIRGMYCLRHCEELKDESGVFLIKNNVTCHEPKDEKYKS